MTPEDRKQALIQLAEKVMGWRVYTSGRGSTVAQVGYTKAGGWDYSHILATTHPWEVITWNPLENIADAWTLVEALRKLGWDAKVEALGNTPRWSVRFHLHRPPSCLYGKGDHDLPAEAICAAALAVAGRLSTTEATK